MTKHNKKRNPGFLYEVLIKELSKTIVSEDKKKRSAIIKIITESFANHTELYKELNIYRSLYETQHVTKEFATQVLLESKKEFANLNQNKLLKEKNVLISKINKNIGKIAFQTFIPNYKTLATIAQIMNKGPKIKKNIMLEQSLIEFMTSEKKDEINMKPIDDLVLKTFMKKYNEKYKCLKPKQQKLMKEYIMSFSDNGLSLKIHLNEEIKEIKKHLRHYIENNQNEEIKEKTKEVLNLFESFSKSPIDEKVINRVMKTYEFLEEIQNNEN